MFADISVVAGWLAAAAAFATLLLGVLVAFFFTRRQKNLSAVEVYSHLNAKLEDDPEVSETRVTLARQYLVQQTPTDQQLRTVLLPMERIAWAVKRRLITKRTVWEWTGDAIIVYWYAFKQQIDEIRDEEPAYYKYLARLVKKLERLNRRLCKSWPLGYPERGDIADAMRDELMRPGSRAADSDTARAASPRRPRPKLNSRSVVIIGGGHNGLTAANLLAQAGMAVTVVEKNEKVGGAAFTGEFAPGLKYAECAYSLGMMRESLMRRLGVWPRRKLPQGGYFAPRAAGGYLRLPYKARDCELRAKAARDAELKAKAARDAELKAKCGKSDLKAYNKYQAWIEKVNRLLQPWMNYTRRVGTSDTRHCRWYAPPDGITLIEELRQTSVGRILDEGFRSKVRGFDVDPIQSDQLKGIKAVSASICTKGPYSPESIFSVLNLQGDWGFPEGGMGKLSDDIAEKAQEWGATIRTNTTVEKIKVVNSKASGVILGDETEIDADIVVTAVDPHISYLKLLDSDGQDAIGEDFLKRIRDLPCESGTVKVNLALDRRVLPRDFKDHPE